ncbi:MAG: hypothetical protein M0P13_07135 [Fibrobacteraceae bacterium]|nr:hypothetical protein [Fibrobacteraceae bacterium]
MKQFMTMCVAFVCAVFMAGCASSGEKVDVAVMQKKVVEKDSVTRSPVDQLDSIQRELEKKGIPCGIGAATSNDEKEARSLSEETARTQIVTSVETIDRNYEEQYLKNVGEVQKIWKENYNALTQKKTDSTTYKITSSTGGGKGQFSLMIKNPSQAGGKYQIFTLIIRDPALFKNAGDSTTAAASEKPMIQRESRDMQNRMEKAAEEYKAKYTK